MISWGVVCPSPIRLTLDSPFCDNCTYLFASWIALFRLCMGLMFIIACYYYLLLVIFWVLALDATYPRAHHKYRSLSLFLSLNNQSNPAELYSIFLDMDVLTDVTYLPFIIMWWVARENYIWIFRKRVKCKISQWAVGSLWLKVSWRYSQEFD